MSRFSAGQTAVIVPVGAVDGIVSPWRRQFDSSAAVGVPPHVTIVFPFLPADRLTERDLADLAGVFRAEPVFEVTFASFGRFAGAEGEQDVLYLRPDPAAPFRRLIAAMGERWPQAPPYEGRYGEPIPHLTVTETAPAAAMALARASVQSRLPVTATVDRGCLLTFDGGRWREQAALPFRR